VRPVCLSGDRLARSPVTGVRDSAARNQPTWPALTSLDLTNPDHRLSAHLATKIVESHMAISLPI